MTARLILFYFQKKYIESIKLIARRYKSGLYRLAYKKIFYINGGENTLNAGNFFPFV